MRFDAPENVRAPWLRFYGKVPAHLDYPEGSSREEAEKVALPFVGSCIDGA